MAVVSEGRVNKRKDDARRTPPPNCFAKDWGGGGTKDVDEVEERPSGGWSLYGSPAASCNAEWATQYVRLNSSYLVGTNQSTCLLPVVSSVSRCLKLPPASEPSAGPSSSQEPQQTSDTSQSTGRKAARDKRVGSDGVKRVWQQPVEG